MPTAIHARRLLGVVAGFTATALLGSALTLPASAAPADPFTDGSSKIKRADLSNTSRVVKDRYFIETAGTPLSRGGSKSANKAAQDSVKTAARAAGATVKGSFAELWNGITVNATESQVQRLAKSPNVTAVYPVLKVAMPRTETTKTSVTSALADITANGVAQTGAGIKVGVIDSGIDYNNADLGGSGRVGGDTFGTTRVQYGWDFVGDDYDSGSEAHSTPAEDADPDDCNGHGTHVAGIIGANGSGEDSTVGVAPEVTLGAYRVFGCDGSTDTEVILKALAKAHQDGMDIVNLSLGSDFDSWPSYPDAVAVANLAKDGVAVVVAAGNSGDTGLFSAGAPAVGAGIISVASFEAEKIRTRAIGVGASKIAYTDLHGSPAVPADDITTLDLRVASSLTACKKLTPVPPNTALLIKRGTCTFADKAFYAATAGAAAVVFYNSSSGLDSFTAGSDIDIPAVAISGTDGTNLYKAIGKAKTKTLPMTWLKLQTDVSNPDGGKISRFSSAGIAADLSLVPTISAPGGKIYSTLPIEQGGHGNMSGTSMAAPFVAGSVALLLEAKPALKGQPGKVAELLYNSAVPVSKATESGVTKYSEAVFRQGSGLVKVANAIDAEVSASPSVLKLGEGTSHTVILTLTNNSATETLTYKPSQVTGVSAAASTGSSTFVGNTTPKYGYGAVGFTAYTKSVTLAPGASGVVKLKITAPSKVLKGKKGMLYGGWVKFTTTGAGNAISVPFVGVRGDYQSVKLLNKFRFVPGNGKTYPLPALGAVDESTIYYGLSQKANRHTFDLDTFYPTVLYHLDYPASDVRLRVINTKTKKSYYAIINWEAASAEEATHFGPQSRDNFAQLVVFEGYYVDPTGNLGFVPDGNYQLQVKVLKPLGTSSKSSHWETYTSPKFDIST